MWVLTSAILNLFVSVGIHLGSIPREFCHYGGLRIQAREDIRPVSCQHMAPSIEASTVAACCLRLFQHLRWPSCATIPMCIACCAHCRYAVLIVMLCRHFQVHRLVRTPSQQDTSLLRGLTVVHVEFWNFANCLCAGLNFMRRLTSPRMKIKGQIRNVCRGRCAPNLKLFF